MRVFVSILILAVSAFAQVSPAAPTPACGPANISFSVQLDDSQHTPAEPEPGKARVYFVHDAGTGFLAWYPTVKVAVDGTWVGANHGNSYFSVSVDPGEHHVCVNLQSSVVAQRVELAHFTATAGSVITTAQDWLYRGAWSCCSSKRSTAIKGSIWWSCFRWLLQSQRSDAM